MIELTTRRELINLNFVFKGFNYFLAVGDGINKNSRNSHTYLITAKVSHKPSFNELQGGRRLQTKKVG